MPRYVIHNTAATDTAEGKPLAFYAAQRLTLDWSVFSWLGIGEPTWTTKEAAKHYLTRWWAELVKRRLERTPDRGWWRLVVEKA